MGRGNFSPGKRQRDAEQDRKRLRKEARRSRKRRTGPGEIPVTSVEAFTGDLKAEEAARIRRDAMPREVKPFPCRLFVGSLSWNTTAEELRAAFEPFGTVTDAIIVNDRDTGKSRGFGFVTMANPKDAPRAIEALNGTEIDGRNIVVNVATERPR